MANKAGKGGGARKIGRNKEKCGRYEAQSRRAKNKAKHIAAQERFIAKKQAEKAGVA